MIVADQADTLKLPVATIIMIAAQYNLDPKLLTAIILVESGGNRFAVRYQPNYRHLCKVGAFSKDLGIKYLTEKTFQKTSHGLMQIMGGTARYLGFKGYPAQLYEPENNIRYGAKLLWELKKRYADPRDIVASYNAGQAKKTKTGQYINQGYVNKVYRKLELLQKGEGL